MDSVRSGPFGQIFRPDNFIFGQVRLPNTETTAFVFSDALLIVYRLFLMR